MLGFSTYYRLFVKRFRKEKALQKQIRKYLAWTKKVCHIPFFAKTKKEANEHFFESKRCVLLNEQVQTCKFTKKRTQQTGMSTCQDSHNPVNGHPPKARAEGRRL